MSPDNPICATYIRGFRAPSFNAQAFFDPSKLNVAAAEEIDAFELGATNRFADRAVTLNLAAFSYKCRNQQVINVDPAAARRPGCFRALRNVPCGDEGRAVGLRPRSLRRGRHPRGAIPGYGFSPAMKHAKVM